MINRPILLRTAFAAALLALVGCAGQPMSSSAPPSTIQVYEGTLSPAQEVPPAADSKGTGTVEVRVDTRTYELSWKISFSGLTGPASMGHIHGPAAAGANAGVVIPFPGVANATSAEGKGMMTTAQYGDLAAGLYYANVHTARYPGGEIRGQLRRRP